MADHLLDCSDESDDHEITVRIGDDEFAAQVTEEHRLTFDKPMPVEIDIDVPAVGGLFTDTVTIETALEDMTLSFNGGKSLREYVEEYR